MIRIGYNYNKYGRLTKASIEGHSENYNEGNEHLLVCNSVTIAATMIGLAFTELMGIDVLKKWGKGIVEIDIENYLGKEVNILMKTLEITIDKLEEKYPKHIKINKFKAIL